MRHLIALALIASTAVLVEIKCQTTTNSTTLPETSSTLGTSDGKLGEVHCSAPGPFPNGWIDATQNLPLGMSKVGRAIVYRCNTNMKQIGASEAICEMSGRWSKNPPQCLASCTVPLVAHGVIRDAAMNGSIISHGENVILECNQSYQPAHGLSKYMCNNGTLNVTPRCDPGDLSNRSESPKGNCDRPDILNGTFVQIDGKNVTRNQTYDIGTEIVYRCKNPGHRMNDTGLEHSTRICNATTKSWTGPRPECVATCRTLIPPSNDTDNDLHLRFDVTYDEAELSGGRYQIGTKAIMRCNFGERVIHPSTAAAQHSNNTVVCQSNGTWRGFVPLCDPPPNNLDLSHIAIIVACVVSLLIFALAVVLLCESRSRRAQRSRSRVVENHFHRTDSQRMRTELLRQSRRETFYALEDRRPDGEREYATIHRVGQSSRRPRLAVEYSKL